MAEHLTNTDSEQYIVTARKWRPQRFADVVGQEHVSRTLRNAVESKRIHHAYIFNGPRGVGKTTTARILAKAVNCENPSAEFEPCNVCASCTDINTGRSMDVIEIDGASNNSVDDIRKLRENAKYPPVKGQYKMYIIDEIHMLSSSAFNALLKTLEEPPRHLLFVFATTEPHKIPATILSRCQRFDFRRMQIDEIAAQLRHISQQEGVSIDDETLAIIGKKGDGSMRDAQSIFDQVLAFCGKNVEYARVNEALNLIDTEFYFTLGRAIREHDVAKILEIAREVFMRGYDLQECLHGLAEHFRNLLTVLATQSASLIEASKLHREQYMSESTYFTQADVLQYMTIIMNTEQQLRYAPQPRLRFEFALVQMAKLDSAVLLSELLAELAELKKKLPELREGIKEKGKGIKGEEQKEKDNVESSSILDSSLVDVAPNDGREELSTKHISSENLVELAGKIPLPQAPKAAPRRITAAILQAEWREALEEHEKLDAAIRTYLQTPAMVGVQCNDGELIFSVKSYLIADKFVECKQHLSEILSAVLGGEVRIRVLGASDGGGAASAFQDFVQKNDEESTPPESAPELAVQEQKHISPSLVTTPSAAELYELDRAIIEHFGATEIPVRT
ncbi:MAG: DNA polymerase III subunit gamma/tau [Candidatus Kapaibacterium sp.]|nr:MAG: DNA polymerase III subunit gamma/tau [Candidatus Kapabacteria bacterium]